MVQPGVSKSRKKLALVGSMTQLEGKRADFKPNLSTARTAHVKNRIRIAENKSSAKFKQFAYTTSMGSREYSRDLVCMVLFSIRPSNVFRYG